MSQGARSSNVNANVDVDVDVSVDAKGHATLLAGGMPHKTMLGTSFAAQIGPGLSVGE